MADWLLDRTAEGGRVKASWAEYRKAFINLYPGLPPSVTRDVWTALTQDNCGSYHKYVEYFQQQAEELQAGEPERIHNFKKGLQARIRNRVEIDPVTTREWSSFANLRDAATGYAHALLTSSANAGAGHGKGEPRELNRKLKSSADRSPSSSQKRKRSYVDNGRARKIALLKYHRKKGLCDLCHEPGHIRANCPDPARNPDW